MRGRIARPDWLIRGHPHSSSANQHRVKYWLLIPLPDHGNGTGRIVRRCELDMNAMVLILLQSVRYPVPFGIRVLEFPKESTVQWSGNHQV